jgi:hypothetical protein
MPMIFAPSRDKARAILVGRFVDNGPDAPKGKRFARHVPIGGSAHQRRKALRSMLRQVN